MHRSEIPEEVARRIAGAYASLPRVEAVALGGSRATGVSDEGSDVDLYVYTDGELPAEARAAVSAGSPRAEMGNRFFEPGDEWVDASSGVHLDVMFRDPAWIEGEMDRVLVRHEARVGYSTAFWHNVRSSTVLFDRRGWYTRLAARAAAPYPEPLRRAVVAKNRPLLAGNLGSYQAQLARAAARRDLVSSNHRAAAFLASYFDILFALNRLPHPGEKRLVALAEARCPLRPQGLAAGVEALLGAAAPGGDGAEGAHLAGALAAALDPLLAGERLWP